MMRHLCLLLILVCAAPVFAQEHQHAQTQPKKTVVLMQGMGSLHHPIATTSPEAQKFFDQGMTMVYGFNHAEAISSFQRAAELDPNAIMPLWGVAYALGPNYNMDVDPAAEKAAFEAMQKAVALIPKAKENERAYVEALSKRYTDDPKADLKQYSAAYSRAMAELVKQYPDDLDAATLYAESLMDLNPWKLWTLDGKPAEGTEEIVNTLLSVLRRNPNHVGANHYYIHALEASPHPEQALASAKRLETLVPAAGHLVHMPAHIYIRTGDYAAAARQNDIAARTDEAYFKTHGTEGIYPIMYYNHNLDFFSSASAMEGRFQAAKKAADQIRANALPHIKEMAMIEPFSLKPWFILVRFQKWDDVLKIPQPEKDLSVSNSAWHFCRGVALAATGKTSEAEKERAAMAETAKGVKEDALWGLNPSRTILDVAVLELDARILESRGDRKGAIDAWRKTVEAQDLIAYDEPPDWYYPTRESLGAALYRDGQFAEAEKVFRGDLDRNPRNPRSLFGLLQCLKAQKKDSDASMLQLQLSDVWKNGEIELKMETM